MRVEMTGRAARNEMTLKGLSGEREVRSGIERICPETAKAMLEKTKENGFVNRHVSLRIVENYASAMRRGEWECNGETIKISTAGSVIDGQHRLLAVIASGVTIKCLVVRNVSDSAFKSIDKGKKRTHGDILGIMGYSNRNVLAAASRIVMRFEKTESFTQGPNASSGVMDSELSMPVFEYIAQNPDIIESTQFICQHKNYEWSRPVSHVTALHCIFARKSQDDCDEFFRKLAKSDFDGEFDPVKMLHDTYSMMDRRRKMLASAYYRGAIWIKSWNHFRAGMQFGGNNSLAFNPEKQDFPKVK